MMFAAGLPLSFPSSLPVVDTGACLLSTPLHSEDTKHATSLRGGVLQQCKHRRSHHQNAVAHTSDAVRGRNAV